MADSTATISREQRAAADFSDAASHIRSHFELPEDRLAVDAVTEAALRFGACELGMRRADRLRDEAEAKELATLAMGEKSSGWRRCPASGR